MTPVSVIIVCANMADMLEPAIRSSRWADEVIVIDSGSTDETEAISRRLADRYVQEPWRGHTGQKQFAAELCRNDWILIVDGDEECSSELASEIQALTPADPDRHDVYLVPRRNYVMGRYVRAWSPDHLTRFFHRRRCVWDGHVLHDQRLPSSPARTRKLRGWLIHKRHSLGGFKDFFNGALEDSRAVPVAQQMYDRGRRCHWWDVLLRPAFAFIKFYFLKAGFLDGTFGLLIAQKAAVGAHLKYAALWAVQHGEADRTKGQARSQRRVAG